MVQLNHIDKDGAVWWYAWYVRIHILNVILYLIASQCKSNNVAEIWENLDKRAKMLAAVFLNFL